MLICATRLGDCIDIGPGLAKIHLTSVNVLKRNVEIRVDLPTFPMSMELQEDAFFSITDQVGIKLMHCKKEKAVFGFVAPREIKIERMAKGERQDVEKPAQKA